jgi:hypothetical protein
LNFNIHLLHFLSDDINLGQSRVDNLVEFAKAGDEAYTQYRAKGGQISDPVQVNRKFSSNRYFRSFTYQRDPGAHFGMEIGGRNSKGSRRLAVRYCTQGLERATCGASCQAAVTHNLQKPRTLPIEFMMDP